MKKIKIFLLSIASSIGAMAADIDVRPGQLEGILNGDEAKGQTELKLRGSIDARDLAAMESLPEGIETLDLSEVSIASLTTPSRKFFGRTFFKEGEIPAYAFFKSGVKTLRLPVGVSEINEGTFAGSDITAIVIPDGVESIGDYAFYGCPDLESVVLPASLKSIGKGAFGNCRSLKAVDLSATGVTEIPERAFAGSTSLETVSLPSAVSRVGREAFSHTAVKALSLTGVTEFEAYALSGMPMLEELALGRDAAVSEGLLMDDISLHSLSGVPELLPDYFAANCGQLDAEIAGNAESLGRYSLANTKAPEVLILPAYFEHIGRGALSGLGSITKIDVTALENRVPEVDEFTFEGIDPTQIVLWVDDAAFDAWESHPVWHLFKVMSTEQTGVDEIGADVSGSLSISVAGGMLVVESPAVVDDVRVYTADGRLVYVSSPSRERVEIEISSLPSGVVVVAAADRQGGAKTVSFLMK